MSKYLLEVSYSAEGAKGILKDGGTKRRQVVEAAVTANGARIEAFYFAFGTSDAVVIVDVPDRASLIAQNLAVNASGAATIKTTVLITPEEMDQASKKSPVYTPPGR